MNPATPLPSLIECEEHDRELVEERLLNNARHLVLWNDEVSTYETVVRVLTEILGYTKARALETTMAVEAFGKGIVFTGSVELCELRHEQFGYAKLTTTIESV